MYGVGTLGGAESKGRAINDSGHITGNSQLSDSAFSHAFFYDGNTMLDIGTLGGTGSDGNDINNSDYIVGASLNSNGQGRAFLYKNGSMFDLCVLSNCVTRDGIFCCRRML
jgi:probable HAF family extracellular repeat protein